MYTEARELVIELVFGHRYDGRTGFDRPRLHVWQAEEVLAWLELNVVSAYPLVIEA